ncbi:tight junction protein ZO-1-like isoform X2 [Clytia hemisphaerica]|uniref:PDZ domain-containing protein n=1 Tax=Clytia hemisphaerica TaxID=252671 RepID=A0A7M5X9K5_9CNID
MASSEDSQWDKFLQKLKSDYVEFEDVESADQILEAIHKLKDDKLTSEQNRLSSETRLQKTYESVRSLRKSVAELKVKEETHDVLTKRLIQQEQELEKMKTENEELKLENTNLKDRINQTHSDGASVVSNDSGVVVQRDESTALCAQLEEKVQKYEKEIADLRDRIEEPISESLQKFLEKLREGTTEVKLEERNEQNKYGVNFTMCKNIPKVDESRIVINQVDPTLVRDESVCVGDYVVEINGHCTLLATMDDVRYYCGNQSDHLRLRIRRPKVVEHEITGRAVAFVDWKLEMGIFFKNVSRRGLGDEKGLIDGDEIIDVANSSKPISEITIDKIQKKMSREQGVTMRIRRTNGPRVFNAPRPDDDRSDTSSTRDQRPSHHALNHGRSSVTAFPRVEEHPPTMMSRPGIPRENTIHISVVKRHYEFFGWSFIGGNKVGIFVQNVENHLAAYNSKIQVGWKLLEVDGYSLENVAYSFALELITYFSGAEVISCLFEKTTEEEYQEQIGIKPRDSFFVKTLRSFEDERRQKVFNKDEILHVKDTSESNQYWIAYRKNNIGNTPPLKIPSMRSHFSRQYADHTYQVIDADEPAPPPPPQRRGFFNFGGNRSSSIQDLDTFYELLDPVEVRRAYEQDNMGPSIAMNGVVNG